VEEVPQVIRNRLNIDPSPSERSYLQVENVMELLDICLTAKYFHIEDKLYQHKDGMAVGNSVSTVVTDVLIFMEHLEEIALDTAQHKSAKRLRYNEETFVVWPHGPTRVQQFLLHFNSLRPTMTFTAEVEVNDTLSFLDVFFVKGIPNLATKMYRKPTHT
jgi:hypothetical protein